MFWTNEYFSCLRNPDARVPQQANKSIYILESGRWPEIPPLITPLLHMVLGINICHGSGTQREVGLKGEFRVSVTFILLSSTSLACGPLSHYLLFSSLILATSVQLTLLSPTWVLSFTILFRTRFATAICRRLLSILHHNSCTIVTFILSICSIQITFCGNNDVVGLT